METQNKNCQNCKKHFIIEPEDFNYYKKIKVSPPTWCPECRMIRRMACVNWWYLFFRNCDKCGKRTLSMYPPEQKITVYCQSCWWADDWDGTEYAMDYDSSRPFLVQLKELTEKIPYAALESTYSTLKNCEYCNALAYSKNCTLITGSDYCENVYFSSILNGLKYSADCIRGFNSELCYESIGFTKNYKTFFSDECDTCVNVWFSRNCYSCTDCIGCVNLRGATRCIFNVKYSKEEYVKKVDGLHLDSWKKLHELEKKAHEFWLTKPYREYNGHSLNLNVTGEHVYTSKNSKEMYIVNGAENCKWCQLISVSPIKDCMDYSNWGANAELIYESTSVGDNVSNVKFSVYCFPDILNTEYSLWCPASKNNFGCAGLKRKNYSILNKQYSKDNYEKLCERIVIDMKKNPLVDKLGRVWTYGELFQPSFGKFAYNNSNAYKFFPKTKEEAIAEGYAWNDEIESQADATILGKDLPDTIKEADESILREAISCVNCERRYKIASLEFDLLRKMNLPLPRECLKCRESKLFARMTKPKLYNRTCMKCGADIYTPYAPEDSKIVYCVKCYQQEFI